MRNWSASARRRGGEHRAVDRRVCRGKFCLVPDHRLAGAGARHQGLLRCRPRRAGGGQRHGHRGGLDECGFVYFHGRTDFHHGLRRRGLFDGVDRRLCAARLDARAVPAQVRTFHRAGFCRGPLRLQRGPLGCGGLCAVCQFHLRGRANARGRGGFQPFHRGGYQHRRGHRHGHRFCLCHARRDEGDHPGRRWRSIGC